ncbi:xylanase [Mucilaginibacter galii]|uniref:Xylanase n=1 Tax=Mucilaginibacter galii TaxID=2005073 RepID=A0A917N336_9SPHI|nr:xylanase [Mucilaginibacter galii]GGI52114.1 xylanase [Mucilaginibacter galii]
MMKKQLCCLLTAAVIFVSCKKSTVTTNIAEESTGSQKQTQALATINASALQQNIRGFGGASIRGWIADLTSDQRTKAFSVNNGIGLSVLRVRVPFNSADFAAEKPTIDAAKANGAMVVATAWTAPASMKTSNNIVGGKLKTTSYADYAAHLKSFVTAVGGVSAISPCNEPDWVTDYESMNPTATELADFVAAQGSNCGAPIMAPEPLGMSQTYINSYLSNPTAKSKTSYVCGHIYGATPTVLNTGKETWMTEHYYDTNDANIWSGALNTAKEIHDCMNAGYNMYVWWYIRRSYGFLDESGNVTKRGYAIAHFAKWVRPGANKISCTSNPTPGVYVTAYKNGSQIVTVIINQNTATTYQNFTLSGATISGFNRYVTTSGANLAANTLGVSGGSFGLNLAPSSITTLVSY